MTSAARPVHRARTAPWSVIHALGAAARAPRTALGIARDRTVMTQHSQRDADRRPEAGPRSSASANNVVLGLLAVTVALNSVAVAFGFSQVVKIDREVRWLSVVTSPLNAVGSQGAQTSDAGLVRVELFTDFSCPFCRASARAIDSVRHHFGNTRVAWHLFVIPQPPERDPVGFQAALTSHCVPGPDGQWSMLAAAGDSVWSDQALRRVIASLNIDHDSLERCVAAPATENQVWGDLFFASVRGVTVTPTAYVDGVKITGRLTYDALTELVNSRIAKSQSRTSVHQTASKR